MAIKGILANFADPNDRLVFQYNPTSISEQKAPEWSEVKIPGGNDVLATFANGGGLALDFELFLNAYGEGKRLPSSIGDSVGSTSGDPLYVEKALAFLYRFTEVQPPSGVLPGRAPGLLVFVMGSMRFPGQGAFGNSPGLLVRIASLGVQRTLFHPSQGYTRRATAKLSIKRHIGFPR